MPELRDWNELEARMKPGDRLVTMDREWRQDAWGMNAERRERFDVILRMPVGGGQVMLLKRKGEP